MSEIVFPADFTGNFHRVAEVGGVHQLEILFVLGSGAGGNFIDPFAGVAGEGNYPGRLGAAETHECIEEVVVAADAA